MKHQGTEVFYPPRLDAWRKWLAKNHASNQAIWLVMHNKRSQKPTISWSDAVDVALCYGWIDSKKIKIDEETSYQFFSRRKTNSTWSKRNKERIEQLIAGDLMTEAGLASIVIAKQNGSWTLLDEVEQLLVPPDLEQEFKRTPLAEKFFLKQSRSVKKAILQWLVLAKRPETRQNRIAEIVASACEQRKPKQLQY
jgi:uncharacterized protein YdeI (YjbR/CyaY-like superfamily)